MNEKLIDMLIEDIYVRQKYGEKHNTVRIRLKGFDENKTPILEIFTTKPEEAKKITDAIFQRDVKVEVKSLKIPTFDEIDKKLDEKLDKLTDLFQLGWTYLTSKIEEKFNVGDDFEF